MVVRTTIRRCGADVAMALIVVVWGVHFIVVKDAISDLLPLTFNAIRFVMGLPLLLFLGLRNPAAMRPWQRAREPGPDSGKNRW